MKAMVDKVGERKYVWKSSSGTALNPLWSAALSIGPLIAMDQGIEEYERIGQKVTPTSLNMKVHIERGLADSYVRLTMVRFTDKTTVLNSTSVFESTNSGTENYVTSPFLLDKSQRARFQVLYDKVFIVDDGKQNSVHIDVNIKVKAKPILFQTELATGDSTNNIFLIAISNNPLASSPHMTYDIVAQYKDL